MVETISDFVDFSFSLRLGLYLFDRLGTEDKLRQKLSPIFFCNRNKSTTFVLQLDLIISN